MVKVFSRIVLVCLMVAASVSVVFAAPGIMGEEKSVSDMMMTKEQMTALTPDEMTAMCKSQMSVIMNKRAMGKMMSMMTADQIKTMTDTMLNDKISTDKMLSMGTKEQWLAMNKEQVNMTMDKMLMTMTPDQISTMMDKTMSMLTKEQMTTMMTDNNSSMMKNKMTK